MIKKIFYKFNFFLAAQFLSVFFTLNSASAFEPETKNISILQCLKFSLENNYNILSSKKDIRYSEGAALQTESQFDSAVSAGVDFTRKNSPLNETNKSLLNKDAIENTEKTYSVSYSKKLESGIIINPYISTTSTDADNPASQPETRTGAYLSFTIPLLKGFGKSNAALKEAAKNDIENNKLAFKQSITNSFSEIILSYWHYVMSFKNYQHYKIREKRAYDLYSQTKALVEADEIPASELDQAEANLWDKKTSLISSEESLAKSLDNLYTSMGAVNHDLNNVLIPDNSFEEFEINQEKIMTLDSSVLILVASKNRFDIKESIGREKTIIFREKYYKNRLLPGVDLGFQLGYESLEQDSSFGSLFKSPYSDPAGPSFRVSLNCEFPFKNSGVKGELILQQALLDKQKLASTELVKRMKNEILTSVNVLKKNIRELENAEKTIKLYQKAYKNQEIRFKMGMGTQLDLINYQDKINNADLNLISAKYKYAVSVSKLRYQTATLVSFADDRADVNMKTLTSLPVIRR